MKNTLKIRELFTKHLAGDLLFVDVGAKGELQYIKGLEEITILHAFEPNPSALKELATKYKTSGFKKLHLNERALSDKKGMFPFYIFEHDSMSSLLESDMPNYQKHFGKLKEFERWEKFMNLDKKIEVKAETLDSYFESSNNKIDFLKIDTQGSELTVLKGALELLRQKKVNTIMLEVSTVPIYKEQVLFSEIDLFLRNLHYTLVDFRIYRDDFTSAFSKKIIPKHSGPSGDAIYILNSEVEDKPSKLKKALILMWLGYVSLSLYTLEEAAMLKEEKDIIFDAFQPTLKERVRLLLKNITPPLAWRFFSNRLSAKN
ncbi:hypothetical protein CNR22_11065 [Sphingobacteriaceae bacterium]|nr:hypothetical protein CNR22_11065 [Sphingobacteriaceae bacterium]